MKVFPLHFTRCLIRELFFSIRLSFPQQQSSFEKGGEKKEGRQRVDMDKGLRWYTARNSIFERRLFHATWRVHDST